MVWVVLMFTTVGRHFSTKSAKEKGFPALLSGVRASADVKPNPGTAREKYKIVKKAIQNQYSAFVLHDLMIDLLENIKHAQQYILEPLSLSTDIKTRLSISFLLC
jgi:hypothetical protein